MPEYLSPGVYVEEIEIGAKPIEGVSTSTAGFLGEAERGPTIPQLVTSWLDYKRVFGSYFGDGKYLPYAVEGFFLNGGQRCYVGRIVKSGDDAAASLASQSLKAEGANALTVEAVGEGAWGNRVAIKITRGTFSKPPENPLFKLSIFYWKIVPASPFDPETDLTTRPRPTVTEIFDNLSVIETSPDYYGKRVTGISKLINLSRKSGESGLVPSAAHSGKAQAGAAGSITLAASSSATDGAYNGMYVEITGGKGIGQIRTIIDYDGTTKVAKLDVESGTAQGGAASTITLAASASATNDAYKGKQIEITGGTGTGQIHTITAYNGTTKVATVDAAWATMPDTTSDYLVGGWATVPDTTSDYRLSLLANLGGGADSLADSGTAQSGSANAITLAASASATDNTYNGMQIEITGGTGIGQIRTITAYNGTTKVATVDTAWATVPDTTSVYRVTNPTPTLVLADYERTDSDRPGERKGLTGFAEVDEISIVSAPNALAVAGLPGSLIRHCEILKDRFAIIDAAQASANVSTLDPRNNNDTKYAAFYYPWIYIIDPEAGLMRLIPPGGHVAGIYARSDRERGVYKAPANEVVRGATDLEFQITKGEQDILNPRGVNVIRAFPGRGIRIWGARTLSNDTLWKYINVRRLFIYVEESIDEGTQFVVFEPNNEKLWARVIATITEFLTRVWRDGALMGTKPEEAFFVKCDRATMTQDDIDNGRLICLIGIAPVKPAEFVIFRIAQFPGGSEVTE